jgi:hypothetical protein
MINTKNILNHIGKLLIAVYQAELKSIRLGSSDLYKSLEVNTTNDTVTLSMEDYAEYVDKGRKAGARKVPISVLIKWIKKRGISNSIQVAYAIQTSIYKNGIKGRPFLKRAEDTAEIVIDEEIEKIMSEELDKELKQIIK